ncbi:MAG: TfoX/Sxy family protein [Gammaproteobacteria bacterium]|nr:TfoX/Sxy family protein [Gammaproteobacteria bacterium]
MTASDEYTQYVLEQLQPVLAVNTRRFFGGVGIFYGARHFAMIMGNSLYLAVDDESRPRYEKAGMGPFSYRTKKGIIKVRKYYELPEEILTDPVELKVWARESIRVADKTRKKKSKSKSPRRVKKSTR